MLQGILWLFDDPFSDLLLVGILVSVVLHFREMKLLQKRTNDLTLQVSELKMLIRTMSVVDHTPLLLPMALSDSPQAVHPNRTDALVS
jgi:hypothetical protein